MNIAILTLPVRTNYGGILQAFALQNVLKDMGHRVEVIDTDTCFSIPIQKRPFTYFVRFINKIRGKGGSIFKEQKFNKSFKLECEKTRTFLDKYISRRLIKNYDLNKIKETDYDCIVVGSDQIWRPRFYELFFFNNKVENVYLDFAKNWDIKRIAYAPSFGTDQWEYTDQQTEKCKALLQKFDAISVRENSGVQLCKDHFGIEPMHVLDPTMLLKTEDYLKVVDNYPNLQHKAKGKIFCYILDQKEEKMKLIEGVANKTNRSIHIHNRDEKNEKLPTAQPVEEWLSNFNDAQYVVTDSFHGAVFSIIFNKPFVVILNVGRGASRMLSLLKMFDLDDCLFTDKWTIEAMFSIDWNKVNEKLDNWRKVSFEFLDYLK